MPRAFILLLAVSVGTAAPLSLPLRFEPNRGQAAPAVRFLARAPGYTLSLQDDATAIYALPDDLVRMELLGASPQPPRPGNRLPSVTRWYAGSNPLAWQPDIPHFGRVRFPSVYPGIDLVWYGRKAQLEYAFRLAPGADPARIRLRFHGLRHARIDDNGDLVLAAPHSTLRHRRPVAWQASRRVPARFDLAGDTVSIRLGPYDRARPLVIDPVLLYASYLGGAGFDAAYGIATGASGNVFVTGETASANFPGAGTPRAFRDIFVAKLTSGGTALLYTTILSSGGNDSGRAIALDASDNAYITGIAAGPNFPVTNGALKTTYGGLEDAFVARLDSSGRLVYATYLGDAGSDAGISIAADSSGNAYITGYTGSPRFPTTASAPQKTYQGGAHDAFLAKLNSTGTALIYSTLLGGSGNDQGQALALDALGNACIAGQTDSGSLPVAYALQPTPAGGGDVFLGCLNAAGSAWNFLTYFGGQGRDLVYGLALDSSASLYLAGATYSVNFPVTPGAAQTARSANYDAFVAKFTASGAAVSYATLLGGNGSDAATAIAVDSAGRAWVAGYTSSHDFPTGGAFEPAFSGGFDAFVAQLSADGGSLLFSTYLGSAADDRAWALSLAGENRAWVAGYTASSDFPVAGGALQAAASAPYDAFIAWIDAAPPPSCDFQFSASPPAQVGPGGAAGIYQWTAAAGCSWTITSTAPWITFSSPSSGFGSGSTLYSIAPNTGSARSATVTLTGGMAYPVAVAQDAASSARPSIVTLSPYSGSGAGQVFSLRIYDAGGAANIVLATFGLASAQGGGECLVKYTRSGSLVYLHLMNDAGAQWLGPVPLPGSGTLQNSQCRLDAARSSASLAGSNLTLSLALQFLPAFSGAKIISGATSDSGGLSSNPQTLGAWTVSTAAVPSPLLFYPLTPCRVVDTRGYGFTGSFGPPRLAATSSRTFPLLQGACGIPAAAQAYSLNIAAAPPGPLSYLTIWPAGQPQPIVSTLNSPTGTMVANAAIVPAGAGGAISVYASDPTDVVIDINGYFAPSAPSALAFYPLAPCRLVDTRGNGFSGSFGPPSLPAASSRDFPLPGGSCGIPPGAQAYSLNMTVLPKGPLIFLSTWPAGRAQPVVSTLNAFDGRVVANAAIVSAGTNGAISVYVSNPTDLVIDINGYFAPPGGPQALSFYPATPCRVADTRGYGFTGAFGQPFLPAASSRDFPLPLGVCGIPSTARAYSLNVTVLPPGPLIYLTAWATGQSRPVVSTLNSFAGTIVANAALVPAGSTGAVSVFVSNPSEVVLDINGYLAP